MEKIKVLIVDDEMDFLELMTTRLTDWGYSVITATNGKEAIDAVINKSPDIAILDYIIPQMSGVEILRGIRKINKDIPVVMLTAHPDMKAIKEAGELNIGAFIPKMSAYQDVRSTLKSTLDLISKKLGKAA